MIKKIDSGVQAYYISSMNEFVEVKLVGLVLDPVSQSPVMVLKPFGDERILPIWIGNAEANALTMELESISAPRPMTHDLLADLIDRFQATLVRIEIADVVDGTYFAHLVLKTAGGESLAIDSRPSDAMILAQKFRVPIMVSTYVLKSSGEGMLVAGGLCQAEGLSDLFDCLSGQCQPGEDPLLGH